MSVAEEWDEAGHRLYRDNLPVLEQFHGAKAKLAPFIDGFRAGVLCVLSKQAGQHYHVGVLRLHGLN